MAHIVGGAKSTFCVTLEGRVYAMGDPADGRLGVDPNSLLPATAPTPGPTPTLPIESQAQSPSQSQSQSQPSAQQQQQQQQQGGVTERGSDTRQSAAQCAFAPLTVPTLVSALAKVAIRKVAVNPSGAFAMALAATGNLFFCWRCYFVTNDT